MIRRFGRSSETYLRYCGQFFDNRGMPGASKRDRRVRELYQQQPPRSACVMCADALPAPALTLDGTPFSLCPRCGHVNGLHDDTADYYRSIFQGEDSTLFVQYYSSEGDAAYWQRVADLYQAKADFLMEVLRAEGVDPATVGIADLGAGSGYLVGALLKAGAARVVGHEASPQQVATGNTYLKGPHLRVTDLSCLHEVVAGLESEVVSMIFALEHVHEHREVLAALRDNFRIRYLFFSVPTWGPSNFIEATAPLAVQRHSGGHTHFYTQQSLEWMLDQYGMEVVGEWWFGADMIDLLRSVAINLRESPVCQGAGDHWEVMMRPMIDALQTEIDRRRMCSEVHMVVRFKR